MTEGNSKIMEYCELLNTSSNYLLTFSPFFINHVSVEMMTDLIVNRKKSVLYICVGRPHIFVQKILMNRGITTRSVHFMDMVLYVCRDGDVSNSSRIFMEEGGETLALPTIFKLFKVDQEIESLCLDEVDVVIMDNVSELKTYNNDDQIATFLRLIHDATDEMKKGLFLFHLNNRPNDGIHELMKEMGTEVIEIPNETFR